MRKRLFIPSALVILVLVLSAFMPITALAQDEVPPPPAEASTEEAPPPTEPAVDDVTLPEVLEAAPEGTDVVVLDENGNPVALTSDAAATALISGDPMWCPDGASPGDSECTTQHASFADLLLDLNTNSATYSGNGTIYVAYDYATPLADSSGILIDFFDLNLSSLTIQGGWDFGGNSVVGTSTISTWMDIQDWGSGNSGVSLTINDLIFNSGGGLYVYNDSGTTTADVTLNNVSVYQSDSEGAYVETEGNVEVNDSKFKGNHGNGLQVYADGTVTLNNVVSKWNKWGDGYGGSGFYGSSGGAFTVNGGDFSHNKGYGILYGEGAGPATLTNVIADSNKRNGIEIWSYGDITLTGVSASDNRKSGMELYSVGDVTLNGVTADGNGKYGAFIDNTYGGGDVTISGSTFDWNTWRSWDGELTGLNVESYGDVSLAWVSASHNWGGDGADVGLESGPASLYVTNSAFNDNWSWADDWGWGLYAYANGNITVLNSEASDNSSDGEEWVGGMYLSTPGNVFVDPSYFLNNQGDGLYIEAGGDATVQCSVFDGNGGAGIHSYTAGTLHLNSNTFGTNGDGDFSAHGSGVFVENNDFDCAPKGDKKPVIPPPTGAGGPTWNFVDVAGSETTSLNCEAYRGTILKLSNGDQATLPCPIGDDATLKHASEDELPGSLGDGRTFGSAMDLQVVKGGNPVNPLDPNGLVAFEIPSGMDAGDLAILYWNGSEWEDLGGAVNAEGLFEVSTDKIGVFVLVSK